MKTLIFIALTLQGYYAFAQTIVKGNITDQKGIALAGVNIYIKNSLDGTSSDSVGNFLFKTNRSGNDTLVASYLGYENYEKLLILPLESSDIKIVLKESFDRLDAVVITAGAFEASDEIKNATLRPLDIVTTAGASGDIAGALNTLPGTQKVGETGRLFVRGGDDSETRTFIDGMWVQNPYFSSVGNTPGRGRFSPFLFKGTTFSTGGYSAEYSQALSSTLSMKTIDFPTHDKTDIGIMSIGLSAAQTVVGKKQSISADVEYVNLSPYVSKVKQNRSFSKPFEALQISAVYRYRISTRGLLKIYAAYSKSVVGIVQKDSETLTSNVPNDLNNSFGYFNASYKDFLNDKWSVQSGISYGYLEDNFRTGNTNFSKKDQSLHLKNTWRYDCMENVELRFGAETYLTSTLYKVRNANENFQKVNDVLSGAFLEYDIYITKKFALRPGVRLDYSESVKQVSFTPRISAAYKTGIYSQVSVAYGKYVQKPLGDYLRYDPGLGYERSKHYILNYQVIRQDRTIRAEAYYKKYDDLITFSGLPNGTLTNFANKGFGYAKGFDLFLRDKKTIKNADYWISYSYLDTKRLYHNFPQKSIPSFASAHNFSIVYKHFVTKIRTQIGVTISYASPRKYNNPNETLFNNGQTPSYKDLSLSASFLYKPKIIFHASVSNVPGIKNIFGYRYAQMSDDEGHYKREVINQAAPRFIFLGVFITLSKDKSENQLETF